MLRVFSGIVHSLQSSSPLFYKSSNYICFSLIISLSFNPLLSTSLFLLCCLPLFLPFPHHQLTANSLSSSSSSSSSSSAGQINSASSWGMESGSRPGASSLSPSPGRAGRTTGRGVGMRALSGHRVYLTSAINPLTVRMLRGECVKEPTLWQQVMYLYTLTVSYLLPHRHRVTCVHSIKKTTCCWHHVSIIRICTYTHTERDLRNMVMNCRGRRPHLPHNVLYPWLFA